MFEIEFYQKENGHAPVEDFINSLDERDAEKVSSYIGLLKDMGFQLKEPYIKKIVNTDLWELRPKDKRIMFFYFEKSKIVLLSAFVKKTQKTPKKEIEKAIKYMEDCKKRGE